MDLTKKLTCTAIYFNPSDHIGKYVVRNFHIVEGYKDPQPEEKGRVCDTLSEARYHVPKGAVNVGRQPDDNLAVLEVWVV